jgi:putative ABC transport system permease protein
MTLARIIYNNARQRSLSTLLTSLSVGVGVALIIAILTIKFVARDRLQVGYSGYDIVIGAKGSPLQLVLNVVYNLDVSPGNIPYSTYEKIKKDPRVKWVAPFAVGDNYKGFRIVGTTDEFLKEFQPRAGEPLTFADGKAFIFSESELKEAMAEAAERSKEGKEEKPSKDVHHKEHGHEGHAHEEHVHGEHRVAEAVLGAVAARETGLKVGDTFVAAHGIQESDDAEKHEESPWKVVGILKATGTPVDRVIYINLDSFYHIEGHVIDTDKGLDKEKPKEPEVGEVSALAAKLRSPIHVLSLRRDIDASENSQAAIPAQEIRKLLSIVGNVDRILLAQAVLIVLVSAMGTALAMFNSMNERRKDIAVMRALGARRNMIVAVVVGEAVLIAGLGSVLGVFLGHGVVHLASPYVELAIGFPVAAWEFRSFEAIIFVGMIAIGALAGIGPAISAYRTDVATNLSPHS